MGPLCEEEIRLEDYKDSFKFKMLQVKKSILVDHLIDLFS